MFDYFISFIYFKKKKIRVICEMLRNFHFDVKQELPEDSKGKKIKKTNMNELKKQT